MSYVKIRGRKPRLEPKPKPKKERIIERRFLVREPVPTLKPNPKKERILIRVGNTLLTPGEYRRGMNRYYREQKEKKKNKRK